MSRTIRNARSVLSGFKNPKGNAKYMAMNVRKGAIPPNPWNDLIIDPETKIPLKAMNRMKKKNISRDEAIIKIKKKWGIPSIIAEEIASVVYD